MKLKPDTGQLEDFRCGLEEESIELGGLAKQQIRQYLDEWEREQL